MPRRCLSVSILRNRPKSTFGASSGKPHRRKERIPPGTVALAAANVLRPNNSANAISGPTTATASTGDVIDLSTYERAAHGRNTLT